MTKPLAAVLVKMRPLEPQVLKPYMGRAVHHFVLAVAHRLMAKSDPDLAAWMHGPSAGEVEHRPFTASGPFHRFSEVPDPEPARGNVTIGAPVWIRITALHERVAAMLRTLQAEDPFPCEFDHARWEVETAIPDDDLHPAFETFEALSARYEGAAPREFELRFLTPAVMRTRSEDGYEQYITLPIPSRLFADLSLRWNAFAPTSLRFTDYRAADNRTGHQQFMKRVERNVYVAACDVKAFPLEVHFQRRQHNAPARIAGFVGSATFHNTSPYHPTFAQELAILVDFSFFAGIGRETSIGMGLVRPSFLYPPTRGG